LAHGLEGGDDPNCAYASIESVQSAIEGYRGGKNSNTNAKRLSAKSFRHKVTTVLCKARLPEDEIRIQLGHRREAARTSAGYGEWDPDYLTAVAGDAGFVHLQGKVKTKAIFAVPVAASPAVGSQHRASYSRGIPGYRKLRPPKWHNALK
jgi:hypothetical protein